MKERWFSIFGLFIVLISATALEWQYIHLDFWNDELYTLEHFVFVPLSTTLTDYHVPNNHILASLIFKLIAGVQSIASIDDVIETPWLLRAPLLIFMLLSIFLIWKAGENISKGSGWIGAIALVSSLPFINFMTELRGYGISFFFIAAILWLLTEKHTMLKTLLLLLCSTALSYAIPSNYYLLGGLIAIWFAAGILRKDATMIINAFAMIAGIGLSLICYAPVFSDVFNNEYVTTEDTGFSIPFGNTFRWIWRDLLGYRYILLFVAISGILMLFGSRNKLEQYYTAMLLGAALFPFAISWLRVDNAPMRAFVTILPVIALLSSIGIWQWIKPIKPAWGFLFLFVFITEGAHSIHRSYAENESENRYNIHHHHRAQNLKTKYYQNLYFPNFSVQEFVEENGEMPVLIHACEPHGIRHFLDHYHISHLASDALDSLIQTHTPFYVVSSNPDELMNEVLDRDATAKFESKSTLLSYHNFMLVGFDTIEIKSLAQTLNLDSNDQAILIAPSVAGLEKWLIVDQLHWINSRDPEALKIFNQKINELERPMVALYNTPDHLAIIKASNNFMGHDVAIGNISIDKPQKLSVEKPFSKVLIIEAGNGPFSMVCLEWKVQNHGEGEVNAVFTIDRDGKNLSWQSLVVKRSEFGKVYFTIPMRLQKTDKTSAYLWLRKGEPMEISSTSLKIIE